MTQLEESLLPESAPLARRLAPQICRTDPVTGENCAWYHGFWQYLRLLDLVSTPRHHAGFYHNSIAAAATREGRLEVLISGAVDYSMLAHVLGACRQAGTAPDITVVDICGMPLFLNQWYADRAGAPIRTVRADVLTYESSRGYDVVCTHSFLGQFAEPQRRDLMARWHRLLRPGGLAITVNRVRAQGGTSPVGFTGQQAEALRAAVRGNAERLRERLDLAPEVLERQAEIYLARRRTHPVGPSKEIAWLFEEAGFLVEHLSCAPAESSPQEQISGPGTPGGAEYARVVARRQ